MPNSTIPPISALVQEAIEQAEAVSQRVRTRAETCRRRATSIAPPPSESPSEVPPVRVRVPETVSRRS